MALMLTGEDIPIYEVIIIVATTRIESQLGTGNVIWTMHLPSSFFTPLQREKKKKSQGKHSSGDRQSPVSQSLAIIFCFKQPLAPEHKQINSECKID